MDQTDLSALQLPSYGEQASLRAQIAEALRALLITGQMAPGELYSAPRLAAQFGVSATPVREAMLDLVSEGLVEVVRNKGFRVTAVGDEELDAMAELRTLVEPPVMGMVAEACEGAVAEAVEALRPLAAEIEAAAGREDLVSYIEADTEFHLRFLALHGNDHVVSTVRDLRSRSRLFGLSPLMESGVIMQHVAEHEEMVGLALERDRPRMEALVRRHIGHVRAAWAGPPARA
ncbi:GntR family transcriptional regulator [Ornithinimicrobium avium]|uniref:GntR family transcriptional regulator n=1 Tax=Ornithinimicrobium avium TaxID=2283195 RepID=A0A345NJC2_9MICO|nr:GntR family transcriptional regulator [Ornithinimicrobium avium]AXH95130.1 GntR family transcriptional regulator [Ornithinimicrobium avium]